MATVNEIAVKMTADASDMMSKFEQIDKQVKKIERLQGVLARAGKGGGKLFGDLEAEKQRLRALGDELEKTKKKADSFFTEMDQGTAAMKRFEKTTGLVGTLRNYDRQIEDLEKDLEYLTERGLKPANNALERQILDLKNARDSAVAYSTEVSGSMTTANKAVTKGSGGLAKGSAKMQMALSQAAFGVEDFMTQIQYGLGPALRGAGNNMSMVAHSLKGVGWGAAVGIAMAVLPTLISMFKKVGDEAEDMADRAEAAAKRMGSISKDIFENADFRQREFEGHEDVKAIGELKTKKEVDKALADNQKELDRFKKESEIQGEAVDRVFDAMRTKMAHTRTDVTFIDALIADVKGGKKTLDEAMEELVDLQEARLKQLAEQEAEAKKKVESLAVAMAAAAQGGGAPPKSLMNMFNQAVAEREALKKEREKLEKAQPQMLGVQQRVSDEGISAKQKEQLTRQRELQQDIAKNQAMQEAGEKRKLELEKEGLKTAKDKLAVVNKMAAEMKAEVELHQRGRMKFDELSPEAQRKVDLLKEQKKLKEELKEFDKQKDKVVAGGFSSNVNRGQLIQQALQGKFKDEKDVKRQAIVDKLDEVNEGLRNVDKFKVVGG